MDDRFLSETRSISGSNHIIFQVVVSSIFFMFHPDPWEMIPLSLGKLTARSPENHPEKEHHLNHRPPCVGSTCSGFRGSTVLIIILQTWLANQKDHISGWWFQNGFKYFSFLTVLGEMIQFDQYFSNGLKPPTRFSLTFPNFPTSPKWSCKQSGSTIFSPSC